MIFLKLFVKLQSILMEWQIFDTSVIQITVRWWESLCKDSCFSENWRETLFWKFVSRSNNNTGVTTKIVNIIQGGFLGADPGEFYLTIFLMNLLTYNLLTIASFRIGVPLILLCQKSAESFGICFSREKASVWKIRQPIETRSKVLRS